MTSGCPSPPPLFASIKAVFLEGGFITPSLTSLPIPPPFSLFPLPRPSLQLQPMSKGLPAPPPLFASITAVFLEGGFVSPSLTFTRLFSLPHRVQPIQPMAKGCPSPPLLFASITAVFLEGGFVSPSFADVASILQCGGGTVIPSSPLHSPTAKTLLAAFSNPSNTMNSTTIAAEKRERKEGEAKTLLVVYADVPANTPAGSGKMRQELLLVEKRRAAAGLLGKEVAARACVTHNWIIDSAAAFELKPF
ncbi:unnamed protein product [Closterium sp. Yama58-4]|nr:unnamed protein product [Closterium sp. Yama58-4]